MTAGGRVLSVTGVGETLQDALRKAYATLDKIHFEGKQFRKDIGHRALSRSNTKNRSVTYAEAGVSIDAGNALVEQIKAVVRATRRPGTDAEIGGFGGLFDLNAAGFGSDSLLVAATDGVGTKLKIAHIMNQHDTIGIDLVAMNVNDLVVQGAEPLLFLDYFACGHLDVNVASQVVKGVARGCQEAQCALVGGETAEMPSMYQHGDYDLAGFSVGAVHRQHLLPRLSDIASGDVLLGLASSGVHSNGFSLVRHVISQAGLVYMSPCPFESGKLLGEVLLTPTRIYVRQVLPLVRSGCVKAMAHITGGGFTDNLPRVLPKSLGVKMDATRWPLLPVFRWLKKTGNIADRKLFMSIRTFQAILTFMFARLTR